MDFPLSIHQAIGGPTRAARTVAQACALFYAFADITDDAQDHDMPPDPWETWGWEQAVNTGTSLLFQSLQILYDRVPEKASELVPVFVQAGLEMTHGQHTDLRGQAMEAPTLSEYLTAIQQKSGASFGAYAQAMAIACGRSLAESQDFREFGRLLGTIFQMLNDTYELWSGRLSPDFANRRLTLPFVLALEQLQGEPRERLTGLLSGPATLETQLAVVTFLENTGIKGYATLRIEVYRKRARALASRLGLDTVSYLSRLLDIPAFPDHQVAI